jgi:hypothetical protein
VDGVFDVDKKDYKLRFKGSSNQRVIDVGKSMTAGKAIETDFAEYTPWRSDVGFNFTKIEFMATSRYFIRQ